MSNDAGESDDQITISKRRLMKWLGVGGLGSGAAFGAANTNDGNGSLGGFPMSLTAGRKVDEFWTGPRSAFNAGDLGDNIPAWVDDGEIGVVEDDQLVNLPLGSSANPVPSVHTDVLSDRTWYFDANASASDIQSQLDAAHAAASDGSDAHVVGPVDQIEVSQPLEIDSNVYLYANLKLADGTNDCVLKTRDFDNLTGTDSWYVDGSDSPAGVDTLPHNFGFSGHIDCNKSGNMSDSATAASDGEQISGIAVYGKRYTLDAFVRDGRRTNVYSEGAQKAGQNDWRDAPEATIKLKTTGSLRKGFLFRGPHDTEAESIVTWSNAEEGLRSEFLTGSWSGQMDILYLHGYNNGTGPGGTPGQYQGVAGYRGHLIVDREHCNIDARLNVDNLRLTGATAEVNNACKIDAVSGNGAGDESVPALELNTSDILINGANLTQFGSDGLVINNGNVAVGPVRAKSNGGYGVKLGDGSSVANCQLTIQELDGNTTAGFYYEGGGSNRVVARGTITSGNTGYDTGGSLPANSDMFDIVLGGAGSGVGRSWERGLAAKTGDGSTTVFDVSHNLIGEPSQVFVTPITSDAVGGYAPGFRRDSSKWSLEFDAAPTDTNAVNFEWHAYL